MLVPGLKKMGVNLGDTAILTIAGADTTAALAQLESFTEKWKTEGVDTVFLSGLQVSAQQFVPALVKAMPGVHLIADNTNVDGYGQLLEKAGARPNPYEGILAAVGESAHDYDLGANWKYCAAIYEKYFHQTAPNLEAVVPGPNGHTQDISGAITDSCTELTMFHDIGERVGKYLNDANWVERRRQLREDPRDGRRCTDRSIPGSTTRATRSRSVPGTTPSARKATGAT